MTVDVMNPMTGERATFDLPADGWKAAGRKGLVRFRGAADAACGDVVFGRGRLRLACRDGATDLTLDEPLQEHVDVRVTIGNVRRWCLAFGGEIVTDHGPKGRKPGLFRARRAPAPDVCL
jgi:hypothetical protein